MPLPDASRWLPRNVQGQQQLGQPAAAPTDVPIPDWAAEYIPQEQWNQMVAEATAAAQSSTPTGAGLSPGSVRGWASMTPEQRFTSILNASTARALPQGVVSPFSETGTNIARAGFLGAGIGSIVANLGAAGAAGATAADGLGVASLPPGVGYLPGGVPAVDAAAAAAWGGGAIPSLSQLPTAISTQGGINALTGVAPAVASGLPNWLTDYVLPGVNGLLGADAADDASDAQIAAMDRAIAENQRQFDLTRSDAMPWITGGTEAINRLRDPAANFTTSPGYEWRRSEGQRDIGNTFASRGLGQSGNALRALTEYNQNAASDEFGNWFGQQLNLAGMGSDTARNVSSAGSATADRTGNYLANRGDARASGVLGKYSAISGAGADMYNNWLYRRRAA